MKYFIHSLAILTICCFCGCSSFIDHRQVSRRPHYGNGKKFKPVIAVDAFENRAGFSGQWDLGSGMSDMLTTALLDSGEVIIVERKQVDSVISEIMRQGADLFRKEGRVTRGRLMNAHYLISGVITDFTVTGDSSGWFGYSNKAKIGGGGSKSKVSLNLKLTDIESGEVIGSAAAEGAASSGWFAADVNYKQLSLGGKTFFRTPLGRATTQAINRALDDILHLLPQEYWIPRVADLGVDMVIINGGDNVGVRVGDLFTVREKGRDITDPATGNVIEHVPGNVKGLIRVVEIKALAAHAYIERGSASRVDYLEAVN